MDCSTDISDNEDLIVDRRLTRVLNNEDVICIDKSMSTDVEFDESHEDSEVLRPPTPSPEVAKDMIGQVRGMTQDQVQELLHKLHLTDDEPEEKEDVITDEKDYKEDEEEPNSEHNEQQKKKIQKTQTKKTTKGNTKGGRHHEDGESNVENKINKPKIEEKGKKSNAKNTNVDVQQEDNPSQLGNKKKVPPSDNNQKDHKLNKKLKKEGPSETQEKKAMKSKIDKEETDSNKEKQAKQVKQIDNDNHIKKSERKLETVAETQVEGRVMRTRKAKEVLNEVNGPVKVKVQSKRNGKKQDLERKAEVNTNPLTINKDSKAGPKKKSGKKEVPEMKKVEDNPAIDEDAVVKVKKAGKKVIPESKETNIKEDIKINRQRKNVNKGISEAVQNVDKSEVVTDVKNKKAKKEPANAKGTEIVNEQPIEQVSTENTKLKSKPDLVKNKKNTENKENKISEETIPNKRSAKKK